MKYAAHMSHVNMSYVISPILGLVMSFIIYDIQVSNPDWIRFGDDWR